MNYCKVMPDDHGNLVVCMPDGEPIPAQVKLSISQDCDPDKDKLVVIEFTGIIIMPVSEFNLIKDLPQVSYK